MIVIVANDTPDAIRGMLKRWFVEPRPNIFVGTVNRRTQEKTVEYVKRNARDIGLLIISSYPNCQGYKVEATGPTDRKGIEVAGLWMIAEKWEESPANTLDTAATEPGTEAAVPYKPAA